jgi:hypothetical protein
MLKEKSIINKNIPLKVVEDSFIGNDAFEMLDAVYIPTLGERKNLINVIKSVEAYTKNIIILLSKSKPTWLSEMKCDKLICYDNFLNNYHAKFVNFDSSQNPTRFVSKSYDIPSKRNFALYHSKLKGYKFIGLIDDDITIEAQTLRNICHYKFNNECSLIGLFIYDYPDVSTIDHIDRFILGNPSLISINGNSLFINVQDYVGFFPYTYNEDWIFIFANIISGKKVVGMGSAMQLEHEPWNYNERIKFEQFGELVITGLLETINIDKQQFTEDLGFWQQIYDNYINYLFSLMSNTQNPIWKVKLNIALEQCYKITPKDLSLFISSYNREITLNKY